MFECKYTDPFQHLKTFRKGFALVKLVKINQKHIYNVFMRPKLKLTKRFEKACQTLIFSIPLYTPNYTPPVYASIPLAFGFVSDFYGLSRHNKGIQKYLRDQTMSFKEFSKACRIFLNQFSTCCCGNVKTTSSTMKLLEISIPLKTHHLRNFSAFKNHFLCFKCF